MNGVINRFGATALKRALLFGVVGAVLTSFMVAQAVTTTNLGTSNVKLLTQSYADDTNASTTPSGIFVIDTSAGAATSVEAATTFGALNNALTSGNYAYRFDVKELSGGDWPLNQTYEIKLYGTTGGTVSLLGTYNTLQATADAGLEGVTVTHDVGATVPDSFDIIATRQ